MLMVAGGVWYSYKQDPTVVTVDLEGEVISLTRDVPLSSDNVEVYTDIRVERLITELDLSNKGLTGSLKSEVRLLMNLEKLDISNNKFTGLPAELGQLRTLKILNLSGNPLTGLPQELGKLTNLTTLDLRGTSYSASDLAVIKKGLSASVVILTD